MIAFTRDGAFEMLGMNDLLTVRAHTEELLSKNPALIFGVLAKRDLNQVSFEQRAMAGDPKNPVTQTVRYVPAADFAKLLGFDGIRVDRPRTSCPRGSAPSPPTSRSCWSSSRTPRSQRCHRTCASNS